jgi:acetylornithine deacetylase/succinyl-diaminopimelate desuccinylase-like protein
MKSFDGSYSNVEEVLQEYVRIPSVSGQEQKAGDFLKAVCRNNGLFISDFGSEDGQYNFAASVFPLSSGKPNVVFLNHIDVVPESDSQLRGPYSGNIEDGVIYGRGTIDNKGAAMMQLFGILSIMQDSNLVQSPYNFTFLAVSCEETQCSGGVSYVNEHHFAELNPSVVFGEGPSELTSLMEGEFIQPVFGISVIHKKPLWIELELKSKTNGHGSITPLTYANKELVAALEKLTRKKPKAIYNDINIKFLKDIAQYHKGGKKMVLKHPKLFKPVLTGQLRSHPELFSLFTNTITLTNIYSNSNAVNKLSSVAGAQLDCRLLPDTNEQEFLYMMKKTLKNDDIKITVLKTMPNQQVSSTETIYFKNLSLAIQEKYPKAKTMDMMMPNINDLGAFRAKNIPAYGTLPIFCDTEEVRSVHGKDEHLHISSLYNGAEVFENFIRRMIAVE